MLLILNVDFKDAINSSVVIKEKRCRECKNNGVWSDLKRCEKLRCDRDDLSGEEPIFRIVHPENAPAQQTLFLPDRVVAVYSSGKKCRECLRDGEWSPERTSCFNKRITTLKPPLSCSLDDLLRIEYLQFHYVRIRIESPDGWNKISN